MSTVSLAPRLRAAAFCLFLALLTLGLTRAASATVYYVCPGGTGNGSSWAACGSLQPILSAAHSGDQVWVKAGVYIGNFMTTDGVLVYGHFVGTETSISQRILTNTTPAYTSYLDGNNSGTVYTIPSAATGMNTLDGFTVEEGASGGVYDSSNDTLSVANCIFKNNSSGNGAGVYDDSLLCNVTNCTFINNTASYYGGGIYIGNNSTATVTNCTLTGNSATYHYGGGIYSAGTITITGTAAANSIFSGNSSSAIYTTGTGTTSAAYVTFTDSSSVGINSNTETTNISYCSFMNDNDGVSIASTTSNISECNFSGCSSGYGGGIYETSQFSTISKCTFTDNMADYYGGGIYIGNSTTAVVSTCVFTGNSVTYHYGGAIYDNGTTAIVDCTFNTNSPDAIDLENTGDPTAPAFVKDCLIVGSGTSTSDANGINLGIAGGQTTFVYADILNNTIVKTDIGINIGTTGGAVIVANNILYDNRIGLSGNATISFTSSHNDGFDNVSSYYSGVSPSSSDIMVNPLFVDPATGNYHLTSGSPCIDAGDDSYVMSGDKDLDGNPRISGKHVDIGYYEFQIAPPPVPTWKAVAVGAGPNGTGTMLWDRSDGAMGLWILNSSDAQAKVGPTYGPYAGWTAKAVATANDGTSRVLWTNVSGAAGIWTFNAAGVETLEGATYGPYAGWSAQAVGVASDGTSRVLWTNTNGEAGVWTFGTNDAETLVGPTYGPISGWAVKSMATASNGTTRLLWDRSDGAAGVWTLGTNDTEVTTGTVYGPYTGWTAKAVGASGDGTSRVLWTNVNGAAGVWSFNTADVETIIGPTYGPYSGWSSGALATSSDGTSRVLWNNASRAAGVWTFNTSDVETIVGPTYGPY